MLIRTENAKRYGIYVFYDKDQIADEYNFYFIRELKKELDYLLVICNGGVRESDKVKFEEIADEVLLRENQGYDITAYKLGICRAGWDVLDQYDEILITNSTMFGPLYPFHEMFSAMDQKDVDFWGITNFHAVSFDPFGTIKYGVIPKHVQSFFMAFRKSLYQTEEFRKYWEEFPQIHSYEEAIGFFEAVFTKDFSDQGFRWAVYADSSELEGYTYDPLRDFPRYMIEQKRCPVIKRRSFFHEYGEAMSRSGGEATREALRFIEKELPYDTKMIWDNLLRLENQADLKKRLQLNYILSSEYPKKRTGEIKKIALIMHIYYVDLAEYCRKYACSMPEGTDIYITVPDEERKAGVEQVFKDMKYPVQIRIVGNRGRDVGPFLVGCRDIWDQYDLICKVHAKRVFQVHPMSVGESWAYKCFENLLKNKIFVENVLAAFEDNPYLGMLTPPVPHHGPYYPTVGQGEWGANFPVTKEWADKLGLHVSMDREKEPTAPLGSMFWVRPQALRALREYPWTYEELPEEPVPEDATVLHALERLYPFCVQNEGYYSAWVLADTYAGMELDNYSYLNAELNKAEFEKVGAQRQRELLYAISRLS